MVRSVLTFLGAFAGALLIFVVAVGQLARIDMQTLVVALVLSAAIASVAVWHRLRT
jgi:hypothetical protein